ncbi:helix-turn-helix domain-containing protein [Glycomyces sp. NPDC049804]|uniref:TetR/AcrR family transcriptional regulator n=1 Tax=Glycomyces sp. NPDC049804 TaxID=3154363 RepID=UPI0034444FDC
MAPRSDAARNAELLITAAKELFDQHGPEVALDRIARRAGVGNATLYRHFPTRADLLIAVYEDEVAELCALGQMHADAPDAGDALFTWLDALAAHIADKGTLAFAGTEPHSTRRTALFDRWHASIRAIAERLVERAHEARAIRDDLTAADLLALANAAASAADGPAHARRLTGFIRNGLQAQGTDL